MMKHNNEIHLSCHSQDGIKDLTKFTDNAIKETCVNGEIQAAIIQQRNEYIHNKMMQLDQVKDAHKHTRRLGRIMKYHELLTDVEVSLMRQLLRTVFGSITSKGCEGK